MIKTRTLDCGIRIATEKMPHVQSVIIGVWVHAGAIYERAANAGISHYIEHMMFKGTDKRDAKQIADDIDKIGGLSNAFTGKESTCYYIKTLSSNFEKSVDILSDMLLCSKFDKVEMDKERDVICEEIKMIEDVPEDDAHETIGAQLFHGSALANSIVGTPTTLKAIRRSTILTYLADSYTRENIVISVAGNFDEDSLDGILTKYFAGLPSNAPERGEVTAEGLPRFRSKVKDIEQSHICLATKGLALFAKDYYSLMLLNNIVGGSMNSRLFQSIREQKGLAYSVYSSSSSYRDDGYFNIYAAVGHDNVKKAVEAIMQELKTLRDGGVTEDELSTAKEQMKGSYIFSLESVNGRMFSLGRSHLLTGKVFLPEQVLAFIDEVSLEDIHRAAEIITRPETYSGVVIGRERHDIRKMVNA
ncbi:MAG: insulinase family protein [Clostridiales Family XIII bacterium]|nr:insulinase family protein [Clostridiales Family XIII bacterium]